MATTNGSVFQRQVTGMLLMAAGWGWNAGNFVQPVNTLWGVTADILHAVPLAILLPLSLRIINGAMNGASATGARRGVTGLAIFGMIGCLVMIILGASNPDPNSVGVHTVADWMPVVVQNAGNLLWLSAVLPARRAAAAPVAHAA